MKIETILTKILSGTGSRPFPKHASLDAVRAMILYREGYDLRSIGKFFDMTVEGVRWHLKKFPDYKSLAKERMNTAASGGGTRPKGESKIDPILAWRYYLGGATLLQIAGVFGVHRSSIRSHFLKYHSDAYKQISKGRRNEKRGDANQYFSRELAWELYQKSGWTSERIGAFLGISQSSITRALNKLNPTGYRNMAQDRKRGSGTHKFPVEAAWKLYQNGHTCSAIGEKFGVHESTIWIALKNRPGFDKVSAQGRIRAIITPDGPFISCTAAAKHYGIASSTATWRAQNERSGWRYAA